MRNLLDTHKEKNERIPGPLKSADLMPLLSELGFHFYHMEFFQLFMSVQNGEIIISMYFTVYFLFQ